MKMVICCAVICLIYALSSNVQSRPLPTDLTKTQRNVLEKPPVLSKDLEEGSEKRSTESDSSEDSDSSGIKVPVCPDGWSQNGTSCYIYVSNRLTWEAARNACQAEWAYLVEVTTEPELKFLYSEFFFDRVWIGLTDKATEGFFFWDNSGSSVSFENWGSDQPGNDLSALDCVIMYRGTTENGWETVGCDSTRFATEYICERQADIQ